MYTVRENGHCNAMGDEPDEVMTMWVVQLDSNLDGSPAVDVVHLDSVLHAVHLMPVFGDRMMPMDLTSDQSLDVFQAFYKYKSGRYLIHLFTYFYLVSK